MKENNFYSDEFEQLIREKTEQYKMYPSEQVWKGIHSSLHTKRKWFIGSMSLLVTGILFLAGKELIAPPAHGSLAKKMIAATGSSEGSPSKTTPGVPAHTSFSAFRESISSPTAGRHSSQATDNNPSTDQPYKEINITISNPVISQPDLSKVLSPIVKLPAEAPSLPVIATRGVFPEGPAERSGDGLTGKDGTADGLAMRGAVDGSTARSVIESLSARGSQDTRNNRAGRNGLAAIISSSITIGEMCFMFQFRQANRLREIRLAASC